MIDKIIFIADFFADQVNGGGELNDWELINILRSAGHTVERHNSSNITDNIIRESIAGRNKFIISNFVNIKPSLHDLICKEAEYVIIEHDHKYLKTRNPAKYPDFKVPNEKIINRDFYKNAKAVFCQSEFHMKILEKNLKIDNLFNLSGNLWSLEHLKILEEIGKLEKKEICAIMDYPIEHKNTSDAIKYCRGKGLKYKLIAPCPPQEFLRKLGECNTFIFFPKSPETLSRVVVEARMMGLKTITTKNIGAIHEPWFSTKGLGLIDEMRHTKREEIPKKIVGLLYE
tara:strand:+ start:2536 stop:3393 length:858 start_codon:yes stop_codon:yes gene_type:complete